MEKKIRPGLLALASGGVILLAMLLLTTRSRQPMAYAQAVETPTPVASPVQRTVSVTGSGSAEVSPDEAIIILGVQTDAPTAAQAMTQNNKQMQAVVDVLHNAGITDADIQTQAIQLIPQYPQPTALPQNQAQPQATPQATPASRAVTYTATNNVQVTVRKLDSLGTVLDQVVAAGGNTIQSISFTLSNPSQAMDQAREAAMKDAQHKAQQLAGLANVKLGTVVSINESSNVPVPFSTRETAVQSAAGVPISPGTQEVNVTVQVTWDLQP